MMQLTPYEAQQRVKAIEREIPVLEARERNLEVLLGTMRKRLSECDPDSADPGVQKRFDDLRMTISQLLEHGFFEDSPQAFPEETASVVGHAGLNPTKRDLAMLRAEFEDRRAFVEQWPDDGVMRRFKYTGLKGRASLHGRKLVEGEIVELNPSQAFAWRDRFELVKEEVQPAAAPS